jgi:hypothetical protein
MKSFSIRLGIVAGALAIIVVGASALATQDPIKKDTRRCRSRQAQSYCSSPTACQDSVYTIGVCRDDVTGAESALTIECCCCTGDADHRTWIGG